jgi:2-polyprenyl-3-methyl-5-hydroxy-6-metoxy-1,4-benzoquinol methylase
MTDWLHAYAERQKRFWNVATKEEARFARAITAAAATDQGGIGMKAGAIDVAKAFAGIAPSREWTLLEVGCGVGRTISQVRQHHEFARVVSVDISEQMVRFAGEEWETTGE